MFTSKRIENPINLDKPLIVNEILTDIGDESLNIRSYYRINETKKIHHDVFHHIASTCFSCGLIDWTRPDESAGVDEFRMAYQLKLIENGWPTDGIHHSIFKKLVLDAINEEKKIFTITDKQLFISKPDNMFPILTLKYDSFKAMLLDMISAANYIKENLGAGKNRDN